MIWKNYLERMIFFKIWVRDDKMKALIRKHEDGTEEVMTEPFSPWVQNNIPFLTGQEKDEEGNPLPGDGWTLIEDYKPEEEA